MRTIFNFFSDFTGKKMITLSISSTLTMLGDYRDMVLGLFVIMAIDLITGIRVYTKKNKCPIKLVQPSTWGVITSAGMRQTISKLKDYLLVILAFFFFENLMLKSDLEIYAYNGTEIIIIFLGVIELWSIGENFKKLRGYNIFEYLKILILKKDPESIINQIKKNNESQPN